MRKLSEEVINFFVRPTENKNFGIYRALEIKLLNRLRLILVT